ncbi:hypothetical protein KKF34_05655 [Myxococcota bacterium]|nr:hypothetical protein [Myxococcota bacterium]MBU1382293.1 hypothetical protein [Myxococcota bacterium]MBU1496347.1 hypothetical protein [Myxococcota bacterium]
MRIHSVQKLSDCIGSTKIIRCHIDTAIDEELMMTLSANGELKYYSHFPAPFFKIKQPQFLLEGIIGSDNFRLTYEGSDITSLINFLSIFFEIESDLPS